MNVWSDERTVMTLDAGGTNFVFSAIKGGKEIVAPIQKKACAIDLELCLQTISEGFKAVEAKLSEKPVAISFAFPGPCDYQNGIIGDLGNLPAFRGGVPLAAILKHQFKIPVFINNDGDLYAYGEALGGILPEINQKLQKSGSPKRYRNLVGITLGTGFGGGLVQNDNLFVGDNSIAMEVWLTASRSYPKRFAEEGVSTRAIIREFLSEAKGTYSGDIMPKDIAQIAKNDAHEDCKAAQKAFAEFGKCLGDSLHTLVCLTDSIIVIGGGITGAADLFLSSALKQMNLAFETADGKNKVNGLVQKVFNIDDAKEMELFVQDQSKEISVQGTNEVVKYDPTPRLALCTSKLGASKAIALGAYAFALRNM